MKVPRRRNGMPEEPGSQHDAPACKPVIRRSVSFIVCFRDPVKRASSHYWNMMREGKEDLPFAEAIAAEDERLEKNGRFVNEQGSILYGYFGGGRHLSRWLAED